MNIPNSKNLCGYIGAIRERFEEVAYQQYFMKFASEFMAAGGIWAPKGEVEPMVDKEEFFKRKEDGCYAVDSLDAAWWGWYANEINRPA